MRRGRLTPALGANFGDHKTFRALAVADEHELAGAELGDAEAAQRFHVHEHVGGAVAG